MADSASKVIRIYVYCAKWGGLVNPKWNALTTGIIIGAGRSPGSKFTERRSVMAIVHIKQHPELTAEKAMEIFKKGLAGKYEVYIAKSQLRDFTIKKSSMIGVSVKLKQEKDKTTFIYTDMIPSMLMALLFASIWYTLLNRSKYQAMMNEVKTFIENAPELK